MYKYSIVCWVILESRKRKIAELIKFYIIKLEMRNIIVLKVLHFNAFISILSKQHLKESLGSHGKSNIPCKLKPNYTYAAMRRHYLHTV